MNKAIFLDRDGTLNVDKGYVYRIEDFEWIPGALEGLGLFEQLGYKIIIVTNQSGIARGYYTESDFKALNRWMLDFLEARQIHIEKVYYCPHLPDAKITAYRKNCNCRKPKLGLFEQAITEWDIDVKQSYVIGDKLRDCKLCETDGCKGFLVGRNEQTKIIEEVRHGKYKHISYAENVLDCAQKVFLADNCQKQSER